MTKYRIIPHPTQPGYWTVCISDENGEAIYGAFSHRHLALAYLLTL